MQDTLTVRAACPHDCPDTCVMHVTVQDGRAIKDVHTSYGHNYALINEPAIAPLGEAKPNTQIFREFAARMGFDEPCFRDSDEDMARVAFARHIDFDALRSTGWVRLPLPELTHQRLTDIGRAPSFYDCLVEVEAADRAVP